MCVEKWCVTGMPLRRGREAGVEKCSEAGGRACALWVDRKLSGQRGLVRG